MRWFVSPGRRVLQRTCFALIPLVIAAFAISACDLGEGPSPIVTDAADPATPSSSTPGATTVPPTPLPTPTPDPRAGRTLVVCLGEEPASLFPFGNPSDAAQAVLQAVYDGPIDRLDFTHRPVILAKLPSLSDGDAAVQPAPVSVGASVLSPGGGIVTLAPGTIVRPSGCYSDDCAVEYDGSDGFTMDQMSATFRLLAGLLWSDGAPLDASDSVFSFNLAAAPEAPGSKFKIERTESYQMLDDLTLEWRGIPGYLDPAYMTNFWAPLPEHSWGAISPADLLNSDLATRLPLSYGPYQIEEWSAGEFIQLGWNPSYFRSNEGLPKFEHLVFRFVEPGSQESVDQLLSGECDILDRTTRLDDAAPRLEQLTAEGRLNFTVQANLDWEQVTFGIVPASYEDGFNGLVDRPNFFGDPRTRQAVAMCMDREAVIREVLLGASAVPQTYVPPTHPLAAAGAAVYPYDPESAAQLLEEAGWLDDDGDPATPRVAQGVQEAPFGTRLAFTYMVAGGEDRLRAAEILTRSMAPCGISAEVVALEEPEAYASGPDGPLFGRQFDMGQFAWRVDGEPACFLFQSDSVPGEPGAVDAEGRPRHLFGWGGWNLSGYSSPEFDRACRDARSAIPESPAYQENHRTAQTVFAADLPAVPLYMRLNLAAARPDLCNFLPDSTARSDLWNLEQIDYGEGCGG